MYPEYNKVKAKCAEANLLFNTSRTMEDIFVLATKRESPLDISIKKERIKNTNILHLESTLLKSLRFYRTS